MMIDQQTLLDHALGLPESERADLAAKLLESLDGAKEDGVEEAWNREIARRLADIDAGEVELVPWDQAREMIFGSSDEP